MRVHLLGNICNTNYVLGKFLRSAGVDAQLYLSERIHAQESPEAEDPELKKSGLPDWVHFYPQQRKFFEPSYAVTPALLSELSACDLLHVQGYQGVIWAAQTGRPWIWHPYGGDFAHHLFWVKDWLLTYHFGIPTTDPRNFLLPLKMRAAMKSMNALVIGWHDATWMAGYKLIWAEKLQDRIRRLHVALDTDRFSPGIPDLELRRMFAPNGELLIFHPSRQMFSDPRNYMKGNDRLYRALGRLKAKGLQFSLVVVDKQDPDVSAAKALIEKVGIRDCVRWVPAMPRSELVRWYRTADLTADAFIDGGLGALALEAMACGCPVMIYIQTALREDIFFDPSQLYDVLPPVLNVSTEDEIAASLEECVVNRPVLEARRAQSRAWAVGHASGPSMAEQFIGLYSELLRSVKGGD